MQQRVCLTPTAPGRRIAAGRGGGGISEQSRQAPVREAIEIAVYLLLVLGLLAWCLVIVGPFISFLLWGTVIAVSLYTPFLWLERRLGGRRKLAVLVFAVLGLALVIAPAWLFTESLIVSARGLQAALQSGDLDIPRANENVRDWPVIGEALYANWSAAALNFEEWIETYHDQLRRVAETLLSKAAGMAVTVLQFIAAVLVASFMLAGASGSRRFMERLSRRLAGDQGEEMLSLAIATIRSVTVGVLGIAFIQALLAGIGMVAVGVPAAGVWALLILVLAIAQLPPWLVLLPVIFYVFSTSDSALVSWVFAVWSMAVSFADMVLKPLMLGRGVEAPMPVILLGAIGGMLHSGIIGLFVGAVVLALGYKLFMAWLADDAPEANPTPDP